MVRSHVTPQVTKRAGRQINASQPASRPVGGSEIGLSRSEGKEFSAHEEPVGPPVERKASRHHHAVPSVERSSSSTTLPRIPEDEAGSRLLLGAAVIDIKEAFAKRASLMLEGLWGVMGSALQQIGVTARGILEPIASIFAGGARPAGDLGGRAPPVELPPISSGTGLLAGNSLSAAGSSGSGFGPLLAVLTLLALAACKGRFWDPYAIPKPGLVPRLTPERPG